MNEYSIRNKRLSDEDFFRIRREEVLPQWETSREIEDLDDNIAQAYELSVGAGKNYALKQREYCEGGKHLFHPQFGQALTEFMLDGMGFVEAGYPLAPDGMWNIFSDSYTRKNNYRMAAVAIERSRKEGTTMLNGWPIVNHGVEDARRIKKAIQSPMSLNSTDEDGRLASEIALAAGWNACNCRSIQEVMSHCKDITLAEEIRINQYESRLAAIYHERGVPQSPHISCNLTGYDSCGFKSFVMVAQSLLGAEQGIKQFFLEFGINMNLIQDIAMMRVTKRLCEEYCKRFGYDDIFFIQNNHMFQGAFPPRLEECSAMMSYALTIGLLGGSTSLLLKCQDEAFATPSREGMGASVRIAREIETLVGALRLPVGKEILEEERILELEVRAMMEKCLEAGGGDIALGLCLGVDAGWVQTMVTPWKHNRGNVLIMRDTENAMRYYKTGDMPLPKEVVEYHLEKLKGRAEKEGRPLDFDMVVADLQYASRLPEVKG